MKNQLDPFYLIVDNADWIERLIPLGVKLIQLRFKDQPDNLARPEILRAQKLCTQYNCQLIVNDYWQIAIDLKCDYVHLGQGDLDNADIPALKKAGIKIGLSTHDHSELERALMHDPDYIALGPVYPTILKKMPWAPQGLEKLSEWKGLIGDKSLVAIGGLNPERIEGIFAAGADSAAVVTDITLNDNPEQRVKTWIKTVGSIAK